MSDKTLQDLLKLDLSDYAIAPYNVTSDKAPEEKNQLLSLKLRGSTIGTQWKTPTIDTLTGLRDRTPTAVEDFVWSISTNLNDSIRNIIPSIAIEAITNPTGFTVGTAAATVGMKAGAELGKSATRAFWQKALGGLGAIVGGATTGAIAGTALSTTETAGAELDSPLDPRYQQRMLAELETKYVNNEITESEYQETKAQYTQFIRQADEIFKRSAVNKNEKNEVVDLTEGREYPEGRIVDSVLSWGAEAIKDRADLRALQMTQRNMNPNGVANTAGSIIGNLAPLYASSYMYRNALMRPRYKTIKGVYNVKTGAEKVVEVPTKLSREQTTEKVESLGKAFTFAQMSTQYERENILDYIDRTGDKDLTYYNPSDIQGAMAGAYGAIGTMTEYELGGIEPLIAGSFKKVGLKLPTARAIAKTAGQEALEESVQTLEEFLSRNIDDTNKQTWGELLTDSVKGAVWGAVMGGTIGGYTFRANRRNLVKGIVKYGNGQITEEQATQLADSIIETAEETVDYKKNERLEKIKKLVSATYENADIPEAETQDAINATAALEYAMIVQWNTLNGTNIDDDPLFKGEVNELGYFRTGIPETQRAKIEEYLTEVRDLQKKLKTAQEELKTARADEKTTPEQIKELGKRISELESKLETAQSNEYRLEKIGQMIVEDKRAIRAEIRKRAEELKIIQAAQREQAKEERKAQKEKERETIREMNRAIAQQKAEQEQLRQTRVRHATTESLRNILKGRENWDDATVDRMTPVELRNAVLRLKDVDISQLAQKSVLQSQQEQSKDKPKEKITAKKLFKGRINRQFAAESGIRDAWGFSKNDPAQNFYFTSKGGIKDWDEIVEALLMEGYFGTGETYGETYEKQDRIEEKAKDFVLNNKDLNEPEETTEVEEIDYFKEIGLDILRQTKKFTEQELNDMSADKIREELIKLAPAEEQEELDIDINEIPEDWQSRKRGYYTSFYRFILTANKMDSSTLAHELAHDWFEQYMSYAQSGTAPKDFVRTWNTIEKALEIDPDNQASIRRGSEIFARSYEAWLINKQNWDKNIALRDPEKDALRETFQNYQKHLKNIYENVTDPYFKDTWGKIGELKPEIAKWFDKVTETTDIDSQLRSGTITEQQANQMKIEKAIDTAIENGDLSEEDKRDIRNARTLNDTSRYEVEGGNKNALQNRLSELARNIDENNMVINKQYDTRRDMIAVAEAADNFVRTRTQEALDIINGRAPETEGLFATDLYTALERLANETNDLALVEQLSESEIAQKLAKELGQRVAGFRNYLADGRIDTVNLLNAVNRKLDKAIAQKGRTDLKTAETLFTEELKVQDNKADQQIDEILKEMECK